MTRIKQVPPQPGLLRWEIGIALLVKLILLVSLWFLIFRWLQQPVEKPDIAKHLALPAAATISSDVSTLPQKEVPHVR